MSNEYTCNAVVTQCAGIDGRTHMAVQSGALLGGLDGASVGMIRAEVWRYRPNGAAKSVDEGVIVSDKSCLQ